MVKLFEAGSYDTDKYCNGYLNFYSELFAPIRESTKLVLEIGVLSGGSLCLLRDYFCNALVIGIDIQLPKLADTDSLLLLQIDQTKPNELERLYQYGEFDIIIDDGCHHGSAIATSFQALFSRVRSGGYYVIEDWGVGYMGWSDSPLAFIQNTVDLCGRGSVKYVGLYSGFGGHLAVIQKA